MIEAKELRIGNLVTKSLKSENGRKLDSQIGCEDIVRIYNNTGNFIYEPIPINEEWLLKFGAFHIEGWTWGFEIDNITTLSVTYAEGKYYWSLRQWDLKNEINMFHLIDINILYIHQLQNLYFALTRKELTCK